MRSILDSTFTWGVSRCTMVDMALVDMRKHASGQNKREGLGSVGFTEAGSRYALVRAAAIKHKQW